MSSAVLPFVPHRILEEKSMRLCIPSRKVLKEERQIRTEKNLEAEVLRVLSGGQIWKAANLADELGEDREAVIACLSNLAMRGRIRTGTGTFDNPAPDYWSLG